MIPVRFDHFITYIEAPSIESYLEEYRAAGFNIAERTVRHDLGLRNGFLSIGPEYIEFCWVEDEDLFSAAGPEERVIRAARRPFGLGLVSDDVQALHDAWSALGYEAPPVWSKAPRDSAPDTPPEWSFQAPPADSLPGASSFVLTYHTGSRATDLGRPRLAPNTIYAIAGVAFVCSEPAERAQRWRDLLAPDAAIERGEDAASVLIGPHRATWMTSDAYQTTYHLPWAPAPHATGELAVFHLLASDLTTARAMLEHAGRGVTATTDAQGQLTSLCVAADPRDGLVYEIRQRPPEDWLRERIAHTGEQLEFENLDPE